MGPTLPTRQALAGPPAQAEAGAHPPSPRHRRIPPPGSVPLWPDGVRPRWPASQPPLAPPRHEHRRLVQEAWGGGQSTRVSGGRQECPCRSPARPAPAGQTEGSKGWGEPHAVGTRHGGSAGPRSATGRRGAGGQGGRRGLPSTRVSPGLPGGTVSGSESRARRHQPPPSASAHLCAHLRPEAASGALQRGARSAQKEMVPWD